MSPDPRGEDLMISIARRRARRTGTPWAQGLNLVPLVDILTSIVFFSLLTYSGSAGVLASLDLVPGAAAIASGQTRAAPPAPVDVTLWVDAAGLRLDVPGDGERRWAGLDADALRQLRSALTVRRAGATVRVTVLPADELSYETLVAVLSAVRAAGQPDVALGIRPRG
jgi:biopolymer transport protein ExbD